MDIAPEKLCRVAVTEDEELWEWYRCPNCSSMKFCYREASSNAVYVHIRCMNCGNDISLKIGSKAEKKRRNNRRRRERNTLHEDE